MLELHPSLAKHQLQRLGQLTADKYRPQGFVPANQLLPRQLEHIHRQIPREPIRELLVVDRAGRVEMPVSKHVCLERREWQGDFSLLVCTLGQDSAQVGERPTQELG